MRHWPKVKTNKPYVHYNEDNYTTWQIVDVNLLQTYHVQAQGKHCTFTSLFSCSLCLSCFSWLVTEAKPLLITPSSCWCPSTFTLRVLLLLSQIKAHIHINIKVLNKAKYIVKQKMTNRFQAYLVLARFSTSATFARCRAVDISTLTWTTSSAIWFSLDATRALAFTMFNLR